MRCVLCSVLWPLCSSSPPTAWLPLNTYAVRCHMGIISRKWRNGQNSHSFALLWYITFKLGMRRACSYHRWRIYFRPELTIAALWKENGSQLPSESMLFHNKARPFLGLTFTPSSENTTRYVIEVSNRGNDSRKSTWKYGFSTVFDVLEIDQNGGKSVSPVWIVYRTIVMSLISNSVSIWRHLKWLAPSIDIKCLQAPHQC